MKAFRIVEDPSVPPGEARVREEGPVTVRLVDGRIVFVREYRDLVRITGLDLAP